MQEEVLEGVASPSSTPRRSQCWRIEEIVSKLNSNNEPPCDEMEISLHSPDRTQNQSVVATTGLTRSGGQNSRELDYPNIFDENEEDYSDCFYQDSILECNDLFIDFSKEALEPSSFVGKNLSLGQKTVLVIDETDDSICQNDARSLPSEPRSVAFIDQHYDITPAEQPPSQKIATISTAPRSSVAATIPANQKSIDAFSALDFLNPRKRPHSSSSSSSLSTAAALQPAQVYHCEPCSAEFTDERKFQFHMIEAHYTKHTKPSLPECSEDELKKFACEMCDERFVLKKSLKHHQLEKHNKYFSYIKHLQELNTKVENYSSMRRKVIQNAKRCGESSSSMQTSMQHGEDNAINEPEYMCGSCGIYFSVEAQLRQHNIERHTLEFFQNMAKHGKQFTYTLSHTHT